MSFHRYLLVVAVIASFGVAFISTTPQEGPGDTRDSNTNPNIYASIRYGKICKQSGNGMPAVYSTSGDPQQCCGMYPNYYTKNYHKTNERTLAMEHTQNTGADFYHFSSWQTYIDNQLIAEGLTQAAIIGFDGNTWASNNLSLDSGEGSALADLFNNPSNAFATGITIGSVTYAAIKADTLSIYGKHGNCGIVTAKTGSCIIIGVYDENFQPGQATNALEKLGEYLRENGF